jgi:hypothetical protein
LLQAVSSKGEALPLPWDQVQHKELLVRCVGLANAADDDANANDNANDVDVALRAPWHTSYTEAFL